ncbi:MAG: hypothetical protein NDP13_06935, partial [Crenarchaeota archaeon]|nr:hypothetical protein [Thermoproteota archaeon]
MTKEIRTILLALFLLTALVLTEVHSLEVLIGHSSLKDVYYQGEDLIIDVSVWNNGTSALRIIHFNLTIWRVEKRYDRLRNVELVYNSTIKKNETISPG